MSAQGHAPDRTLLPDNFLNPRGLDHYYVFLPAVKSACINLLNQLEVPVKESQYVLPKLINVINVIIVGT